MARAYKVPPVIFWSAVKDGMSNQKTFAQVAKELSDRVGKEVSTLYVKQRFQREREKINQLIDTLPDDKLSELLTKKGKSSRSLSGTGTRPPRPVCWIAFWTLCCPDSI